MDKRIKKIGLAALLLALIAGSVFLSRRFHLTQDDIRNFLLARGAWASGMYIVLLTVLPLILFPDSVIVIAGGMVFGLFWGTVLTVIGSVAGAVVAFWIARYLGQDFVQKRLKFDLVELDQNHSGFVLILILRLIPLFPFKIVSYSAGLANVRFWDYFWATTLGSMPGILAYVNIGDKSQDMGSSGFWISIALLILLVGASLVGKKWWENRKQSDGKELS